LVSWHKADRVNIYKTAAKELSEILFNVNLSSINGLVANQEYGA
jgi:hypothetical protein